MRKRPSGADLIKIADQTEASANPDAGNARYVAAMIRNARAIAERQALAGNGPDTAEKAALKELTGGDGSLHDLNRTLVRAIRDGKAPTGTHAALTALNRSELAESNPRYLERLTAKDPD